MEPNSPLDETNNTVDLVVIGGGVNGTGIAADAAGRGLSVLLCEQNDLASATSSNSSKLIHGGLRYLEHYEFKLVQQALAEREVLLRNAPHIMHPLRFILPHQPHLRPAWMIRAGLFLYDHLAKRETLASSSGIKFTNDSPLVDSIKKGFKYSDGWVDDARLVVLNALSAKNHGADIRTYTRCENITEQGDHWQVTLSTAKKGNDEPQQFAIKSKALVNAAGPWVSSLFTQIDNINAPQQIRLVKGSHIIVPRIHQDEDAYILQNPDGRIVFVLPFEQDFSIVGTTDVEYEGSPSDVAIDDNEIDYLIDISNQYFKQKISRNDIISSYSGVRPLMDDESVDAQKVTRDYTIEEYLSDDGKPLLSVFGGKITTYRRLSEKVVNQLSKTFPEMTNAWTASAPLPGGDFNSPNELLAKLEVSHSFIPSKTLYRYVKSYGTLVTTLLADVTKLEDMGQDLGHGLYEKEVRYLVEHEWAKTADDILRRRTKLGLRFNQEEVDRLEATVQNILSE